jgi:ABC-type multidrug transport system ATPase subunit
MAGMTLSAQGVCLTLSGRQIVDNVSLRASLGKWVSIVGANEAGKTSLLQLLAGWRPPSSGEILFHNRPLMTDDRVEIVLAPGPDELPGHLLGSELLSIVQHERQRPKPANWSAILAALNADRWWDRPINQLSLGTRRKVALATALCASPSILLLDEAFDALDAQSSVRIRLMVREIVDSGAMGVISASHAWESVFTDSDSIAFLAAGRVVRQLERAQFVELAAQSARMQETILAAFATPAGATR